tara:strand:- start:89 stop:208 length:120 start_codon:yes stop_codon:yes gene_type:complete
MGIILPTKKVYSRIRELDGVGVIEGTGKLPQWFPCCNMG